MALVNPSEPQVGAAPSVALFALGFRPFYLLAGAYAALSVPLWAAQFAGWLPGANPLWHAQAFVRVFVPLVLPDAYVTWILFSAVLWFVAFALFTAVYFPILSRPRLDGQPG